MTNDLLEKWWVPTTGWWQITAMRVLSSAIWIVLAVDLIERIQRGRLASALTGVGMLCWISALTVAPACWGIFDALPGSNSRTALTLLTLFGFMLHVSGLIARYSI